MEDDLQSETSGYFRRLLVSQCNAGREEGDDVDDDKAQEEAQAIYDVSIKLGHINKMLRFSGEIPIWKLMRAAFYFLFLSGPKVDAAGFYSVRPLKKVDAP